MINPNEINKLVRKLNHLRFHGGVPVDTITIDTPFAKIREMVGNDRLAAQIRQAIRHGEI